MPDVYATITDVDVAVQERLADILELRAADLQQRSMLDSYLSEAELGSGARVLEIGCGTGPVTRVLARLPGVAEAVGVDPSPVFISRARELGGADTNATFEQGDGRHLRFADVDFDAVVMHTTLCHIPQPDQVLSEAFRVLRPGGNLAVFDGDYATGYGRNRRVRSPPELHRRGKGCLHQRSLAGPTHASPAAIRRVRAATFAEPRLPADRRSGVHVDPGGPWRRHPRVMGTHRAGSVYIAEGRGAAAS